MYRRWPRLADGIAICPIQLPGREDRTAERLPASYAELAADLTEGLLPYLDRPFAFFGHGAGALIGYEATVRLRRHRSPTPSRLCVSAQVAPHHGPHDLLARRRGPSIVAQAEVLVQRVYGSQANALESCLRVLPADIELLHRYRPIEPVDIGCPITAIGWRDDERVDHASMRGWAECGPTNFILLDGGHSTFVDPPGALIDALVEGLAPGAPPFGPRRITSHNDN